MPNSQLQRKKIDSVEDFADGVGLGAKIASIKVTGVRAGTSFGGAQFESSGYLEAGVSIAIDYAAGYSIGGDYIYTSTGAISSSAPIEELIAYTENGGFDFDIAYLKEDYLPFNNWWVEVHSDEVLLNEIIDVGYDSYGDDDDRDSNIGEAFSFSYDESCREVAYKMLSNLCVSELSNTDSPFTDSFVADIDKQARQAIAEYLENTIKK